jgi:hypothetical protein
LFCTELMPDFQPTSEVTWLAPKYNIPSQSWFWLYLCCSQNTMPAPLARDIAYNAVGPISALGFRSPTLAQLMARYATTDPTLSRLLTGGKVYLWLLLQMPRGEELSRKSLLR